MASYNQSERVVAYVPFTTFLSVIDALGRAPDIRGKIDTSVWPTYSPATRAQLLGSFRFLGLIDSSGKPTVILKSLVRDRATRKAVMRRILESSYARIVRLGLTEISPRQFDMAMRQYGMSGDTHKKVVSFFLQAAKYSDLPMAPLITRRTRASGPRRRTRTENVDGSLTRASVAVPSDSSPHLISKAVGLRNGGRAILTIEGSLIDMAADDREFVFRLIDQLREYSKNNSSTA